MQRLAERGAEIRYYSVSLTDQKGLRNMTDSIRGTMGRLPAFFIARVQWENTPLFITKPKLKSKAFARRK
ncbi:hypothetical protein ACTWKC_13925 [Bacillus sp. 4A_MP3]